MRQRGRQRAEPKASASMRFEEDRLPVPPPSPGSLTALSASEVCLPDGKALIDSITVSTRNGDEALKPAKVNAAIPDEIDGFRAKFYEINLKFRRDRCSSTACESVKNRPIGFATTKMAARAKPTFEAI